MRILKGNYPSRGSVTTIILAFAKRRRPCVGFFPSSLCPPLTLIQAKSNCWRLAKIGLLRRIRKGRGGRLGYYEPRYALR
jgi:hypothetical protein